MLYFENLPYLVNWIIAFGLTLLIELPIYWYLGKVNGLAQKCLLGGFLGTAITHPLLWFVWVHFFNNYHFKIIIGEVLICLIEAFVLWIVARHLRPMRALSISLIANATSFGIGVFLYL